MLQGFRWHHSLRKRKIDVGSKVQSLYIHDNDKWHDNYALLFTMDIDFEPILKALKEIEYDGYFTLETSYLRKNGYAADNILKGLKEMADIVRKMGIEPL